MKPSNPKQEKVVKAYWYKFFVTFCPICGDGKTEKVRQYSKKPKYYEDRYTTTEYYDWCNE